MATKMISVPPTRLRIGLTPDEADRLARELAAMEEALDEPGLSGAPSDASAVIARRRMWLEIAMPAHEVEVGAFEIEEFPVTNAQWARFMAETGARKPDGPGLAVDRNFVTGVAWTEASAYAFHHQLELPTEAEWECAARNDRSLFTWGDAYFPQGDVAFREPVRAPYAVGSRAELRSARGVHDLLGQFGEYTSSPFGPYPGAEVARFEALYPDWRGQRTVRGGYDVNQDATCVSRRGVPENERRTHLKFRCVRRS
jgi:formylglycine-generating enzyme required for sulfatase activity